MAQQTLSTVQYSMYTFFYFYAGLKMKRFLISQITSPTTNQIHGSLLMGFQFRIIKEQEASDIMQDGLKSFKAMAKRFFF